MNNFLPDLLNSIAPIIFTTQFRIIYIIFSVFVIIILVGMVRKHYFRLTMKGARFGFLMGIIVVITIEILIFAVYFYGFKFVDIISGKKESQEVVELTRQGVNRFNQVLGVDTCAGATPSLTRILEQLPNLKKSEEDKIKAVLCH